MTEQTPAQFPDDPTPQWDARQEQNRVEGRMDTSTMTKTETPTSHGMMWAVSSPTGGVLALVRDEAAADLVLTALAAYVPADPPAEEPQAGWMPEKDITDRFEESQSRFRDAGQVQPWPNPDLNAEQQRQLAESPTRHTMPDERPQGDLFDETPQPHQPADGTWPRS